MIRSIFLALTVIVASVSTQCVAETKSVAPSLKDVGVHRPPSSIGIDWFGTDQKGGGGGAEGDRPAIPELGDRPSDPTNSEQTDPTDPDQPKPPR